MPRPLTEWLGYIERLHPRTIELGLDRVHAVLGAMNLRRPPYLSLVVAGTNGKGSTSAMLASCLAAAGYRTGLYTSPHLIRFNERIRINGEPASDEALCQSFEHVEAARGDTRLTYFEFGTLVALHQFAKVGVDVAVLEVGMGGRLDAVNAIDADCAVVTTVDIDHVQWLGETREAIGFEKAGVFRGGCPAICGDPDPPASLVQHARQIGASLQRVGHEFSFEVLPAGWNFRMGDRLRSGLSAPGLRGHHQYFNAASALAALESLSHRLHVTQANVRAGLANGIVQGRFQVLPGSPTRIFDVAHNPEAARSLASTLASHPCEGKTIAVFGMLRDKDIVAVGRALAPRFDRWRVADLDNERGARADEIVQSLREAGVTADVQTHDSPMAAYEAAVGAAAPEDRVVVFGSFYMVGDILARVS